MSGPAVTAERHGRKSMMCGRGRAGGGIAWWRSLLGRINGSSNTRVPTAAPGKTTHILPAWQWGSPAALRWVCTAWRNHLRRFVNVLQISVATRWGRLTLQPPTLTVDQLSLLRQSHKLKLKDRCSLATRLPHVRLPYGASDMQSSSVCGLTGKSLLFLFTAMNKPWMTI